MATLTSIRTGYVDNYLHRGSADTRPWTATEVEANIQVAILRLWEDGIGLRTSGSVATNSTTNTFTLPTNMLRIRRIDLTDSAGVFVDRVGDFRVLMDSDTPTQFVVQPTLADGYTMKVLGYKKMATSGSDLPVDLEPVVAAMAASLCFASLAGELLNSKRQQNEDTGRTVSYNDAAASREYWMAVYRERISNSPYRMRLDPVMARRS